MNAIMKLMDDNFKRRTTSWASVAIPEMKK